VQPRDRFRERATRSVALMCRQPPPLAKEKETEEGGYFPITNEIRENDLDRLGILPPAN
jgi:hypothetical protein